MKVSYSRSITSGMCAALQQHRLRPASPSRAALSRTGHSVTGTVGVKEVGRRSRGGGCHSGAKGCSPALRELGWEQHDVGCYTFRKKQKGAKKQSVVPKSDYNVGVAGFIFGREEILLRFLPLLPGKTTSQVMTVIRVTWRSTYCESVKPLAGLKRSGMHLINKTSIAESIIGFCKGKKAAVASFVWNKGTYKTTEGFYFLPSHEGEDLGKFRKMAGGPRCILKGNLKGDCKCTVRHHLNSTIRSDHCYLFVLCF